MVHVELNVFHGSTCACFKTDSWSRLVSIGFSEFYTRHTRGSDLLPASRTMNAFNLTKVTQ